MQWFALDQTLWRLKIQDPTQPQSSLCGSLFLQSAYKADVLGIKLEEAHI